MTLEKVNRWVTFLIFTCSYCGRKVHLRAFCCDLRRGPKKHISRVTMVPKTKGVMYSSIWVRKTILETLNVRLVDSRMLIHNTSHAKSND